MSVDQESLNRFLALVRKMRFIDYLDPIGVTAEEALAQRLRWAKRSLDDPQHAEEASFLLAHAVDLYEVVRKEEEFDAEDEWTDVFSAVKADSPLLTWMRRDEAMAGSPTDAPPVPAQVTAEQPVEEAAPEEPPPYLSRMEDITPPPMDAAEVEQALAEAGAVIEAPPDDRPEEIVEYTGPSLTVKATPVPAGAEDALVQFDVPTGAVPGDEEDSDIATLIADRDKLGIPSMLHRRTPPLAEAARVALKEGTPDTPELRSVVPPRSSRTPTPAKPSRTATPAPAASTGLVPASEVTPAATTTPRPATPASRGTPIPVGRNGMPNPGFRTPTPTPLPRITGTPAAPRRSIPTPTPSLQKRAQKPPAQQRNLVPFAIAGLAIAGALIAGGAYLYANRTPSEAPEPEPVAVVEPVPEVVPEPVAVAEPVPEPVAERVAEPVADPADASSDGLAAAELEHDDTVATAEIAVEPAPEPVVAPEPAPEPVVVAPEPVLPPVPVPEPAQDPAPALAANVAAITAPVAAPAPAPAVAPAPAARPANMPDLAGTWPGDADGAPLQLTLKSAGGPRMTGTVQIVTPDGTKNVAVTGTWKEDRLELAGRGDALLFGYLRADGGNGTLMFPGMDPFAWQVAPQ